jgi:hypothetical protein
MAKLQLSGTKWGLNDFGAGDLQIYSYSRTLYFITFAGGARLPAFHTGLGANDQLQRACGLLLPMFSAPVVTDGLHVGNFGLCYCTTKDLRASTY